MRSDLFTLHLNDFWKGLVVAVFGAIGASLVVVLSNIINQPGFDVFLVHWTQVGRDALNMSIVAGWGGFTGYIGKNFFSDKEGNFLGK